MSQASLTTKTVDKKAMWFGPAAILLAYLSLYAINYLLPLHEINYTSRIWNWSQLALTTVACILLIVRRRSITVRPVVVGIVLAVISSLSHWLHNPNLNWCIQEGIAVWVCFLAGVILFKNQETISIPAFQPPATHVGRSIILGILFAVPLAVVNNVYFFINYGSVQFQNVLYSAFGALSPAIHEEIIFRFFIFAMSFHLLREASPHRWIMVVAVFLAVVPHSLNHLPELFLENQLMGLTMLIATSLLFGLPMAILQIKRDLESAIAFHWFIDFARFLFGF